MMSKLRTRFLISHVLPLLILAPIVGFTLLYLWENYYYLNSLAKELVVQARIVADFIGDDNTVWTSPHEAAIEGERLQSVLASRVMLLDQRGQLLYSSYPPDMKRMGQALDFPVVSQALHNQSEWEVAYNPSLQNRILDVAVPVANRYSQTIGIVRLSYNLSDIEQRLIPLRWLVGITIIGATLAALLLATLLSNSVSAPLANLAETVAHFSPDRPPPRLPETGPAEVRLLSASFNQVTQHLHELEIGRRELLASFVHELGAPLGAIKAASQALQEGAITEPELAMELADGINSQADQLTLLLKDLTLLRTSELQGLVLHPQWTNFPELIREQCQSFTYLLKQKYITLTYEIVDDLPLLYLDRERICQIIANLISNAYKYTPQCGQIHVSLTLQQVDTYPVVELAVRDNGPGIALSEQTKIFNLFYRSPSTRKFHQGMGIGLALSQQLAEAHEGSLKVKSVFGEGATFILTLPLKSEHMK